MQRKTADMICAGDIILTRDKGEHLVLKVRHDAAETRLRTVDLGTGKPRTRVWKHDRSCAVDVILSFVSQSS